MKEKDHGYSDNIKFNANYLDMPLYTNRIKKCKLRSNTKPLCSIEYNTATYYSHIINLTLTLMLITMNFVSSPGIIGIFF